MSSIGIKNLLQVDDKLEELIRQSQDLPGIDLDHTLTDLLRLTENNLEKYDINNDNNNKKIEIQSELDADSILLFSSLYKQGYDPSKNSKELKKMKLTEVIYILFFIIMIKILFIYLYI
jgi:hypothetical protein